MGKLTTYAVMGNPIEHSLSPTIHTLFAEQTQQNISYERILVPFDGLASAIDTFREQGGHGLNITLPFKTQAWQLANQHSEYANLAQAANTLVFSAQGEIYADNTDGRGLLNDLRNNLNLTLHDKRILILGAGGAARGILLALLTTKPQVCIIANRTLNKAKQLAHEFSVYGQVNACGYHELHNQAFDLVVNATSASLQSATLPLPNSLSIDHGCCYDLVYGNAALPFLQWGKQRGAVLCVDGLGMLVEQAALSFELWRHIKPDTKVVLGMIKPFPAGTTF
jgi:shikimate dehydrogenase